MTVEMIKYARQDTHYFLFIYYKLRIALQITGQLDEVLERSAQISTRRFVKPVLNLRNLEQEAFQADLNDHQIYIAHALCRWRLEQALDHDEVKAYILNC